MEETSVKIEKEKPFTEWTMDDIISKAAEALTTNDIPNGMFRLGLLSGLAMRYRYDAVKIAKAVLADDQLTSHKLARELMAKEGSPLD